MGFFYNGVKDASFSGEKDTVGPTGIQSPVSGDGTNWKDGQCDDEIGHQKHGDGVVQSSLTHNKPWKKRHVIQSSSQMEENNESALNTTQSVIFYMKTFFLWPPAGKMSQNGTACSGGETKTK